MEILLENKTISGYKELSYQIQSTKDSIDSVVPDINDDIGKIASLQHSILLKSKDITANGVSITGIIDINVLYITESEDKIACLKLNKNFSFDYNVSGIEADAVAVISIKLNNIESKIINPRKVSVSFEICGILNVYSPNELETESYVPENQHDLLKQKLETVEINVPCSVCEKTFTINDQHVLHMQESSASKLMYADAKLVCSEVQHVGTKLIVKGMACITISYLTTSENHPMITEFITNFSQIIDTAVENIGYCTIHPELNSIFYDFKESINGEHVVDVELHGVLQAVCYKTHLSKYVSDTYCNKMPVINNNIKCSNMNFSNVQQGKISVDEKLSISDDCRDVLTVIPSLCSTAIDNNKLRATIHFDIIYQDRNSSICSVRRSTCVESEELHQGARLLNYNLCNVYIRPDDSVVDAKLQFEYSYQCADEIEYIKVNSIEMQDDDKYDTTKLASFSIVRLENESLWDLAKKYNSSVEKICAFNDGDNLSGKFIMIPKEC